MLATVRTGRVMSPGKVQEVEQALTQGLHRKVALFFRCAITKDVGATGSASLLARPDLNGNLTSAPESAQAVAVQVAEQTIRDLLVNRPNIILEDVRSVEMPVGQVVIASIQTSQAPVPFQVERVQELIRQRLGRSDITLLIRSVESTDTTAKGIVLLGEAHFAKIPEDQQRVADQLETAGRTKIEGSGEFFVNSIDAAKLGTTWAVRAEVVGPRVPDPGQVKRVEASLTQEAGSPVKLTVWARTDIVVTSEQYDSVDHLIERQVRERLQNQQPAEASP